MNDEARNRIMQTRSRLILQRPFFGFLGMNLTPVENNNMPVPTMGVDGKHLYYDKDFVEGCSDKDLQAIVCHEILHLALQHLWRKGSRNQILFNIACDAVVNYHLEKQGFELPGNAIRMVEAERLSAEELYEKMEQFGKQAGVVMDDHESWSGKEESEGDAKGSEEGESEKDEKDKGDSGGGKPSKSSAGSGKPATAPSKAMDKTSKDLADKLLSPNKATDDISDKWKQLTVQARQVEKMQGKGMGSMESLIDELVEPRLPWKELMRNAVISVVKNDYRLIPPNKKHLWRGVYLPSTYGEEIEIVYAIDTSGSMAIDEIKEGLSELKGICDAFQSYIIWVIQSDYDVQEVIKLTSYDFKFPEKIRGGGGTSFIPVFDEVEKRNIRPSILVYFTDGYGTVPQIKAPYSVIWLVTDQGVDESSRYWREMEKVGTMIRYRKIE